MRLKVCISVGLPGNVRLLAGGRCTLRAASLQMPLDPSRVFVL